MAATNGETVVEPTLTFGLGWGGLSEATAPLDLGGSRDDVHTEPGVYDGYEVVDECPAGAVLGVIGLGDQWFDDVAPGQEGRMSTLGEFLSAVDGVVRDLETPFYVVIGAACRSDYAVVVALSDWRDVDAAILRLGALLRQRNLREEIGITIDAAVSS